MPKGGLVFQKLFQKRKIVTKWVPMGHGFGPRPLNWQSFFAENPFPATPGPGEAQNFQKIRTKSCPKTKQKTKIWFSTLGACRTLPRSRAWSCKVRPRRSCRRKSSRTAGTRCGQARVGFAEECRIINVGLQGGANTMILPKSFWFFVSGLYGPPRGRDWAQMCHRGPAFERRSIVQVRPMATRLAARLRFGKIFAFATSL